MRTATRPPSSLPKLEAGKMLVGHSGTVTALALPTDDGQYWHVAIQGPQWSAATHQPIHRRWLFKTMSRMGFWVSNAIWSYADSPPYRANPYALGLDLSDANKGSLVYFIQCQKTRRVKIGFTKDVDARLKALQTGAPHKLKLLATIPGARKTEQLMHRRFAHLSAQNGEWFECGDDLAEFLTRISERHVSGYSPPVDDGPAK